MIDDHVHPFPLAAAPFDPAEMTLDVRGGPGAGQHRRRVAGGRLFVELLTTRLAAFLGCEPADVPAVRDRVAHADWPGYVRRLFDDAGVEGMILDGAWHPDNTRPAADYAAVAGRPMWEMARLEPLVDDLAAQGVPAREIVAAAEDWMAGAADRGAVAFKTVLAYRTGLAVDPGATCAQAQRSLDADRDGRYRTKPLRDLLLRRLFARAADLGLPVQIHTGFGDSDIRLRDADPLLLDDVLRTPEGSAAPVVLIHGAYPWHEQVAYLAAVRPNVWAEASLFTLFTPATAAGRLLRILELAPRDRVLVGSDGHGAPETHWFACHTLHRAWTEVAAALHAAGARDRWIDDTRHAVFTGTARELYGLDGTG